jgi:2-oxoglutarate ferredoxin oxidoreductase subunit delta
LTIEEGIVNKLRIYQELCKGIEECGICLSVCRREVFKPASMPNRKGYLPPEIAEAESCTSCENCMIFCPDMAIAVTRIRPKGSGKK